RAMLVDGVENGIELLGGLGPYFDLSVATIRLAAADADVLDYEGGAVGQDLVEDFRQQERVDDVPVQLDLFDERRGVGWGAHDLSPARCPSEPGRPLRRQYGTIYCEGARTAPLWRNPANCPSVLAGLFIMPRSIQSVV